VLGRFLTTGLLGKNRGARTRCDPETNRFEPTIEWLRSVLPEEYAKDIQDNWCWPELGRYYKKHNVPKKVIEPIVRAIRKSGGIGVCYLYCRYIENREDLVDVIRESGDAMVCYMYCLHIENREDLVEIIRKSGDAWVCYWYCRDRENREDLVEVIRKSGDARACHWYCRDVENREDLRTIAEWAGFVL